MLLSWGRDEQATARLAEVNAFIEDYWGSLFFGHGFDEISEALGPGQVEGGIAGGTWDQQDTRIDLFLEHLTRRVAWAHPDRVELLVREPDGGGWRIHQLPQ
jgi:hypothetical protein